MPAIGIVDDRNQQREQIRGVFDSCFEDDNWQCIDTSPLIDMNQYAAWIVENDISVLVLDERLHEEAQENGVHAAYNGHELAEFLRQGNSTLPIYVVTSFTSDEDLVDKKMIVENIIDREEFGGRDACMHVSRMLRAGMHYSEIFQEDLSEISRLANKVAIGVADEGDIESLRAKQTSIKLAFPVDMLTDRQQWINELDKETQLFDDLRDRLEKYLQG